MYPRLWAEERLSTLTVTMQATQAGSGHMKQQDWQRIVRELDQQARGPQAPPKRTTPDEAKAMAARLGFL